MELLLNFFLKLLKGLTARGQWKLKNNSLWSIYVRLWLKFPKVSGWKIKHKVPYWGEFRRGKLPFLKILSLFPLENFLQQKLFPMKIFPDEKLYLPNTFLKVEFKTDEQTTFDIPTVNMVED